MALYQSTFSLIGTLTILALVLGLFLDVKSADNTQGGYEHPFEGWSGTPIDFSVMSQTKEGLFKKGYVVDQLFNCNTGLITWEVFGVIKGEFRLFSERAIVVHKPQDECKARGFNPNS